MSQYRTQPIPFTQGIENQGIDNFEFPFDMLTADGFYVHRVNLTNTGQYEEELWKLAELRLKAELLDEFPRAFGSQTVVLDVQVGRGKTTACYKLIKQYCEDKHVTVIMVSPFRKLVDKDHTAIISAGLGAFHYADLDRGPFDAASVIDDALSHQVHVMTVNCLLQNPGEDAFDTSDIKKQYLYRLLEYCKRNKRKVILFFDEIHEAIYNFRPQFIPNLYKWRDVVELCFVASATFNAASYPVVKYISLLTNRHITILSVDRAKWIPSDMSRLHLHIVRDVYHGSNLYPLEHLKDILRRSGGKQVNILTGTKSLTEALMNATNGNRSANSFYESLAPFELKKVTPDYKNEFVQDGNNIGTTFKTGVNIKTDDGRASVLIIILPVVKQNATESIFSDGIPSIVQAIGRLRQAGDIHIFMHQPTHIIEPDDDAVWYIMGENDTDHSDNPDERVPYRFMKQFVSTRERLSYPTLTDNVTSKKFIEQRKSVEELRRQYEKQREETREEIQLLEESSLGIGYRYPSFEEYLIEEGHKLVRNYPQFGSDLSSYVLWAALNDQFCNATLTEMTYTSMPRRDVDLNSPDIKTGLLEVLSDRVIAQACRVDLRTAVWALLNVLSKDEHGADIYFRYSANPDKPSKKSFRAPSLSKYANIMQTIVDIWVTKYTAGRISSLSKNDYILACCMIAGSLTNEQLDTDIKRAYHELNLARLAFIEWLDSIAVRVEDNVPLIHKDIFRRITTDTTTGAKELSLRLSDVDNFVSSKTYPFLRSITATSEHGVIQKVLYGEFEKCFTTVSETRRSYNGVSGYYVADVNLERTLPEHILALPLL